MPAKSPLIKVLALFMVGIILPTGFLVYLGVLSIRAETLLLRKESQERVGKTAQAIQDQAQTILVDLFKPLTAGAQAGNTVALDDISRNDPSISMLLLVDANNRLLYPTREFRRQAAPTLIPMSPALRARMELAEQAEFRDRNYTAALQTYQDIGKDVESTRWKAILLNNVAGSHMKLKQFDAAEAQYHEILSRYGQEVDSSGYPFGLVIASQLGELQQAKGRADLAVTSYIRVFQDVMGGRWDLSWEETQFFVRHLTQKVQTIEASMPAADRSRWQNTQDQWERLQNSMARAREFLGKRWPTFQRTLREENRNGDPFLLFSDRQGARAIAYAPFYESRSNTVQTAVIADIETSRLLKKMELTVNQLAEASNLAFRLQIGSEPPVLESPRKPEGKRWPFMGKLAQTFPAMQLSIAPVSDIPVERAAMRRRQVYFGMVALAGVVILIALYATWYAVSREIEVAQLKARFVASMSHELKTPLSIIGLIGQKLKLGRYSSETEAQEYYGMLSEETDRLKSMIEDVLDFSRLLENRKPYKKISVDLAKLTQETIDRFRQSHQEQKLDIEFFPSLGEWKMSGDPDAVSRVLVNLLENAVKYSPADRLKIHVTLRHEGDHIQLSVQDQGYGIPAEEQKLVFERFYRGKSAEEHQKTNGVGLGLAIVKHIVEAHQGTVSLLSKEGQGSTFKVRLPI